MKIAISGASGLVGSALARELQSQGHEVFKLVRGKSSSPHDIYWNPDKHEIDQAKLEGLDAVVHLAGENIASGRWTAKRKQAIVISRVAGTGLIAQAIAKLKQPPAVFACASAIGFYGDRGTETLTESSSTGAGFLAKTCQEWETTAEQAAENGVTRVVKMRFGVILSKKGGMLPKLLPPFLMGAGGPIAHGKQFMSWITLDDAVQAVIQVVSDKTFEGPVNMVAPNAVTNGEFTEALAKTIHRPAFFRVPEVAAKLGFGEMADELLLASQKVIPQKLSQHGFQFKSATIGEALNNVLHNSSH